MRNFLAWMDNIPTKNRTMRRGAILLIFLVPNHTPTSHAQPTARPKKPAASRVVQVHPPRRDLGGPRTNLRKLTSTHLTLYTDLPPSDAVDQLPAVFDAAVPRWADYFGLPQKKISTWHIESYLIRDRQNFAARGLLPKENPDFANGFARSGKIWLLQQPSDYYRRHLLLHEGTHAFMYAHLDAHGPAWYMEGMAELLGTHTWDGKRLLLGQMPSRREEVPMWGRIKIIREAVRKEKLLDLADIMAIDNRHGRWSTDAYAWSWALVRFLDSHPHFQKPFRQLAEGPIDRQFNHRFRKQFDKSWSDMQTEWQAFVIALDYGYDATKMAMQHKPIESIAKSSRAATLAADRGWQSTGWLLQAGRRYRISAEGRYQIAGSSAEPWPCEPGGVTIRYHAGRPLGILLGALRPSTGSRGGEEASFLHPVAIGLQATLVPKRNGVLYLRVNDSPARLSDNRGTLRVSITEDP